MGNDATPNPRTSAGRTSTGTAVPRPASMQSNTNVRYRDLGEAKSQYPLDMFNNSARANDMAFGDYGNIMGEYSQLFNDIKARPSTQFNFNPVSYSRPGELNEAFGSLRSAGAGYQKFADTGGYSDQDVSELRARGIAPIRAAYGNTIRELDRSRSLSGGGANYIAARSRAQRELPGQLADATTNVNAGLADAIRQGKLSGLSGLTQVGSTMGGLSSDEAAKILQASITNSQGQLQAEGMGENARQFDTGMLASLLNSKTNLYGTTPGMANMFGNDAMSYLNTMNRNPKAWEQVMSILGTASPYIGDAIGALGGGGGKGFVQNSVDSVAKQAGGGGGGFWSSLAAPLLALFKGKDGPKGTGGGGTGGGTGPVDNTGRGVNDPPQGTLPTNDQQAMARLQQEYQRSKQGNETFEQWFQRVYGGGRTPVVPPYTFMPGGGM